jgi:hypothetical protein
LRESAFFLFFDDQLIALFGNLAEPCQHAAGAGWDQAAHDHVFFDTIECVDLRALPREQEMALVATILVEHYFKQKMAREVIVAASVLLKHYPNSAQLLIYQGSAYAMILQQEIVPRYKTRGDMPPDVQEFADAVWQRNQEFFQAAEALGWRENEGQPGVQP